MDGLTVLRVFCDEHGGHGNELGVFLDGRRIERARRQEIAAELGFAETVFVDDRERGAIEIYTPAVELPFAGHPTVGTAWLLAREGVPPQALYPPAGGVGVRFDSGATFVSAPPEWAPRFELIEHQTPAAVDALDPAAAGGWAYNWAWIDEAAGIVRARSFVPEAGIAEDEATGAAALLLCAGLGRAIEVRQGRGSVISARPLGDGRIEIGGRVVEAQPAS